MSTLGKVFAGVNLLAAIVVLVLASRALYARSEWAKYIDQLERDRDGLPAEELIGKDKLDPKRSAVVQRIETADKMYEPLKEKPVTSDAVKLAEQIGPDEYKRQVAEQIKIDQPKLFHEERKLIEEKALLLGIKDRYATQIERLQNEIAELKERAQTEKELQERMGNENTQRQREIARTYAELEEALAARKLAESRRRDMEAYLKQVRERAAQLAEQNQKLAEDIQHRELGR